MNINITFDNPLEISPNITRDKLIVYFNESQSMIKCLWNNNYIELNQASATVSVDIPRQITKDYLTLIL